MQKITLLLVAVLLGTATQNSYATFSANLLFAAKLTGDQETPPVTTSAYGVATFSLNATRDTLCINATFRDLSSVPTSAHIHQGSYGLAGPAVIDLTSYISGNNIHAMLTGPVVNPELIGAMIARQFYINVHTANNPDGEIRGQIELETDFHLKAYLSGAQVVPPVTTPAIGLATFDLHKDYMYLRLKVQLTGLSGPITTAQLHYGAPGINGPEVAFLDTFINGNTIIAEIPDTLFIYDLLAGNIYININTAANPIGEVRGQIILQSDFAFDMWLNGNQEVPPTASTSSGAGSITFSPGLDSVYYDVVFDTLSAPPTAAHFHNGRPGESGPVMVNLSTTINGNHLTGMATSLPADFVAKCLRGDVYLNVHSSTYPDGEIRGQVNRYAYEGFSYTINGSQETPPTAATGTGSGFVSIDPEERSAHYRMVVNGLTGPLTQAHFHNAAPGTSGPPVFDLTPYLTAGATNVSASNYWTDIDFAVPFNASFANMFMNNEMYVNFHTAANPDGELRGNIIQGSECFITVGIAGNNLIADNWSIYPVPSSDHVTIQMTGFASTQAQVAVTDLNGRTVLTQACQLIPGENKTELNISSLAPGVYAVRVLTKDSQSGVGRIVKQ